MSKPLKLTIKAVYTTIAEVKDPDFLTFCGTEQKNGESILTFRYEHPDLRHDREQAILRAAGNHRCEYVWSDVLQAHVRLGGD